MARILLIDDETAFLNMTGEMLRTHGHEVTVATGGRQALEMFKASGAELIIVDMFMADMAGLETIVKLKELAPGIPTIAISGGWQGGSLDFLNVAKNMGAYRSFRKPIDDNVLLGAIDELLSHVSGLPEAENGP